MTESYETARKITQTQKTLLIVGGVISLLLVVTLIVVSTYIYVNQKTNANNENRANRIKREAIYRRLLDSEMIKVEWTASSMADVTNRNIWIEDQRRIQRTKIRELYNEMSVDELIQVVRFEHGIRLPD